jgi:Ner family transcriptional regulator
MSIPNVTLDMPKKPAHQDWHVADIKAAVNKAGHTLRSLAREAGYGDVDAVKQALHRPYPKAERIIAEHIGVAPARIWPSRYHADGTPKSGRGERGRGRHSKHSRKNPVQHVNRVRAI